MRLRPPISPSFFIFGEISGVKGLRSEILAGGYQLGELPAVGTRSEFAIQAWEQIRRQPAPALPSKLPGDADGDLIPDSEDPLPFTPGRVSWEIDPATDGIPSIPNPMAEGALAFNFTFRHTKHVPGFRKDFGQQLAPGGEFGWKRDLSHNIRARGIDSGAARDSFVFTRHQDTWECQVPDGHWRVIACLGDIWHGQPGQNLIVEGRVVATNVDTAIGFFKEVDIQTEVSDGWLTLTLGKPEGGSNTCINWLLLIPESKE